MLQYRGFVRQDPISRAYQPGPSLTSVAFAVHSRMDIPRAAAPILRRLADSLQETVHVGMLDGRLVRFIAAIESPLAVRVISRLGGTRPAHCTSTGKKVLLAGLSADELDELYPRPTSGATHRAFRSYPRRIARSIGRGQEERVRNQ